MLEVGVLYRENSIPFERVYNLEIGNCYHNEEGHKLMYIGDDNFEFIKRTPLVPGELMLGLRTKQVQKLFWTLASK